MAHEFAVIRFKLPELDLSRRMRTDVPAGNSISPTLAFVRATENLSPHPVRCPFHKGRPTNYLWYKQSLGGLQTLTSPDICPRKVTLFLANSRELSYSTELTYPTPTPPGQLFWRQSAQESQPGPRSTPGISPIREHLVCSTKSVIISGFCLEEVRISRAGATVSAARHIEEF